jgi:VanZ family protein
VLVSLVVLFVPRTPSEQSIPNLDKVVHATVFLVLAASTRWRFGPRLTALAAVIGYGVASELIQWQWLAHRDGDVRDAAADAIGALAGWLPATRLLTRRVSRGR